MPIIAKQSTKTLKLAINILNSGGVVVCPTDTIYGFLALAENKKAVSKIFKIKKRPIRKPLPVFVCDLKMAKELAEIDEPASAISGFGEARQEKIIKLKWPGKYTFVLRLKNKTKLCKYVTTNKTVAMRVPKYKFLNDLLQKINKPLAQTSVNISNNPPMTKFGEIIKAFGGNKDIDMIIDGGNLKKSKPSAIIDLTGKRLTQIR